MATFALGDVQGCFRTFQKLLGRIGFRLGTDRLWLTGDLVNRGPLSLETLRWAAAHDRDLTTVLGNHDLHLLRCAAGLSEPRGGDTIAEILHAPDCDRLIDWLRARPLFHAEREHVLVHAGLLPSWSLAAAAENARELEEVLGGADWMRALAKLAAGRGRWKSRRDALDVFTRIRMCRPDGPPDYSCSGPPSAAPRELVPWFDAAGGDGFKKTIVFGHWAALGLFRRPGLLGLDSGCVWGGELTACRLEDGRIFRQPSIDKTP